VEAGPYIYFCIRPYSDPVYLCKDVMAANVVSRTPSSTLVRKKDKKGSKKFKY
jgi:hypothetical protein